MCTIDVVTSLELGTYNLFSPFTSDLKLLVKEMKDTMYEVQTGTNFN